MNSDLIKKIKKVVLGKKTTKMAEITILLLHPSKQFLTTSKQFRFDC